VSPDAVPRPGCEATHFGECEDWSPGRKASREVSARRPLSTGEIVVWGRSSGAAAESPRSGRRHPGHRGRVPQAGASEAYAGTVVESHRPPQPGKLRAEKRPCCFRLRSWPKVFEWRSAIPREAGSRKNFQRKENPPQWRGGHDLGRLVIPVGELVSEFTHPSLMLPDFQLLGDDDHPEGRCCDAGGIKQYFPSRGGVDYEAEEPAGQCG
jgi:hypothetical protein